VLTLHEKVELIGGCLDLGVIEVEVAVTILREAAPEVSVVGALELFVDRTRREIDRMGDQVCPEDDDDWTPYRDWDGRWGR